MTTYYTADTHLGHKLLAALRGFLLPNGEPDVPAHDEYVMTTWNALVKPQDTVIHAGDVFLGGQQNLALVARLNGTLILAQGNHDKIHPMHRAWDSHLPRWTEYFQLITPEIITSVTGIPVVISHFPRQGTYEPHGADRFLNWRTELDLMLLHGHTHQDNPLSVHALDQKIIRTDQVCIGWEAWGGPVPEELLGGFIKEFLKQEG